MSSTIMMSSSDSEDLLRLCCLGSEDEDDDGRFRIEERDLGCLTLCSIWLDRDCSHTKEDGPAIAARRMLNLGGLGDFSISVFTYPGWQIYFEGSNMRRFLSPVFEISYPIIV